MPQDFSEQDMFIFYLYLSILLNVLMGSPSFFYLPPSLYWKLLKSILKIKETHWLLLEATEHLTLDEIRARADDGFALHNQYIKKSFVDLQMFQVRQLLQLTFIVIEYLRRP